MQMLASVLVFVFVCVCQCFCASVLVDILSPVGTFV